MMVFQLEPMQPVCMYVVEQQQLWYIIKKEYNLTWATLGCNSYFLESWISGVLHLLWRAGKIQVKVIMKEYWSRTCDFKKWFGD